MTSHAPRTMVICDLQVMALRKNIKRMYLRVAPPHGHVKVTAPLRTLDEEIRHFVTSKLPWIQKQQARLKAQKNGVPKEYTTGETHFLLGAPYRLNIIYHARNPQVVLTGHYLNLYLEPIASKKEKEAVVHDFYRQQLQKLIPPLVEKWSTEMGTRPDEVRIKKMKTKWGTCNTRAKRIWLSLGLVQAPFPCIEYVFVHEMAHLFEANHGPRFYQLMDRYLPTWRTHEAQLREFTLKS